MSSARDGGESGRVVRTRLGTTTSSFERSETLDRPFVSQSPGFAGPGHVPRTDEKTSGEWEVEVQPLRIFEEEALRPTVDDIVDLLASPPENRHYQSGGRPGVRREARRDSDRVAGAPSS